MCTIFKESISVRNWFIFQLSRYVSTQTASLFSLVQKIRSRIGKDLVEICSTLQFYLHQSIQSKNRWHWFLSATSCPPGLRPVVWALIFKIYSSTSDMSLSTSIRNTNCGNPETRIWFILGSACSGIGWLYFQNIDVWRPINIVWSLDVFFSEIQLKLMRS